MRDLRKLKKPKATRILGGALGLLLVLTLVLMPVPVLAVPQMPHQFYGTVTIGTELAPEGTIVSAQIGEVEYLSTTVDAEGRYGYMPEEGGSGIFKVPADDPGTLDIKEGGEAGDMVEFYIGLDEVKANETALFEVWGVTELNLTVTIITHSLTMEVVGEGTVTPESGDYAEGDMAITATPASGWEFSAWSTADMTEIVEPTLASTTLTLDKDKTVTATFTEIPYTLTVDTVGSGSVTKDPDQLTYTYGDVVQLTAVPDTGWSFDGWSGDLTGTTNPDSITMDGNKTVTATFTLQTFTITPTAEAGGSIDPSEAVEVDYGADQVFTITPNTGYVVDDVLVDDISVGAVSSYTFANVTAGHTIHASFVTTETFTITATAGDNGTISPSGAVVVNSGASQAFTITPNTGYAVDDVLVDGISVGAVSSYTFANVTAGHTIHASFVTTETFTITATAGDNGTISPSGAVVVNSGASQAFTITPNAGYAVDDVLVDDVSVGAVSSYTFANVTADHTIHATFAVVVGDLGDEIAGIDPGGTLNLLTGTYTGDVTISQSITITGTVGTIISGGITILELPGSNVTLENLTITDYIDYGIRIVKVRDVDTFTIRNNTIEGLEGDVIGIQVDAVEAGGILTIRENVISGNVTGIRLLADVADATIHFNDITGNTIGLEQLAVVSNASAICNWWGDISGPEYEAASFEDWSNPGGLGDAVSDNVDFIPWLTRDFQTVLDDNIAYFGYPMVWLYAGWNIISTPIALDPVVEWEDSDGIARTGVQTWGDYKALGDGLAIDTGATTYYFDGDTQNYVQVLVTYRLKPCDAIYVKMAEDDIAAILLSPSVSVPSKELYAGWNLVSLAWLPTSMEDMYGLPADEALITVEEVAGGLTGYKLVVSPAVNASEPPWIYIAGDPSPLYPDGWMWITSGYWVFMLNDGTLAGFTFTPVSLGM